MYCVCDASSHVDVICLNKTMSLLLIQCSSFTVYFYNFGWKDYGVASLTTILDMVKVMSFALQEGKVAIHCHAGLGRTGKTLKYFLLHRTSKVKHVPKN